MTRATAHTVSRRQFLCSAGAFAAFGCGRSSTEPVLEAPRLASRPRDVAHQLSAGTVRTNIDGTEVLFHVPRQALLGSRVPLMVFLHGALRTVDPFMDAFRPLADATGVMVLMPYAVSGTWDAITGAFGRDVQSLDRTLSWVFGKIPIAAESVALSGFSDGATYTLALGRANGDLFKRVIAYSPGFLIPVARVGNPPVVISHGTDDTVLLYSKTRDVIVPELRQQGYGVEFRPFTGAHALPLVIAEEQMRALAVTQVTA